MIRISHIELPEGIMLHAVPQLQKVMRGQVRFKDLPSVWVGAAMLALLNADDATVRRCFAHAFVAHVSERDGVTEDVRKIAEQAMAEYEPMPLKRRRPRPVTLKARISHRKK